MAIQYEVTTVRGNGQSIIFNNYNDALMYYHEIRIKHLCKYGYKINKIYKSNLTPKNSRFIYRMI